VPPLDDPPLLPPEEEPLPPPEEPPLLVELPLPLPELPPPLEPPEDAPPELVPEDPPEAPPPELDPPEEPLPFPGLVEFAPQATAQMGTTTPRAIARRPERNEGSGMNETIRERERMTAS
jgi:hypothetical protein